MLSMQNAGEPIIDVSARRLRRYLLTGFTMPECPKMNAQNAVSLRIHSGVPIVDVLGEWAPGVAESVNDMIRSLTASGHFDIVLNIQSATMSGIASLSPLTR